MSFHVVLPSNSSMDIHPRNTLSNFRIQLAKPIELNQPYSVALEEILYPKPNHDFDLNETFITIDKVDVKEIIGYDTRIKRSLSLPPPSPPPPPPLPISFGENIKRIYLKISSNISLKGLVWYLNDQLNEFDWSVECTKGFFAFKKGENSNYVITLHPKLAYALGLVDEPDVISLSKNRIAKHPSPIFYEPTQMFVYGDFVEYQHVGSGLAPLLRICVPQRYGDEYRSEKYIRPYYIPVSKQKIDSIHIEIRTHTGEYFPFPTGNPVVCKLHFKPLA